MIALRVARAVLGWGIGEAAGIIGIEAGSLRRLEQGIRRPSCGTLEIIRAAYGPALERAEECYGAVVTMGRGRPKGPTVRVEPAKVPRRRTRAPRELTVDDWKRAQGSKRGNPRSVA